MEYVNLTLPFGQYPVQPTSPSADLAMDMGTDPTKVQLMRSSFFGMMDDDADEYETKSGMQSQSINVLFCSFHYCWLIPNATVFAVNFENYGDRDSPDQIVPNKRLFTFSSTHSLLSKEVSSTTSSSSIDTPILSPALPIIREREPKKGELISEVNILSTF